jgi:hypothetical protein
MLGMSICSLTVSTVDLCFLQTIQDFMFQKNKTCCFLQCINNLVSFRFLHRNIKIKTIKTGTVPTVLLRENSTNVYVLLPVFAVRSLGNKPNHKIRIA